MTRQCEVSWWIRVWRLLGLGALLVCLLVPRAAGQNFSIDFSGDGGDLGYQAVWDAAQDRLIFYRDATAPQFPAVRLFNRQGQSTPIYPLRDLPAALRLNIWSVAATPDGGVAIAAIADYGEHQVRSLVLTYDASAVLGRVWNVDPCHHHRVAVDRDGNVFAFGERHSATEDYPLLVKYSPHAKVLEEFLPASTFPSGDNVVSTGASTGEHVMFITNDKLSLYIAPAQELLTFDSSGKLRQRLQLEPTLRNIARQTESARAEILSMANAKDGGYVAQFRLWPNLEISENVRFGMARLSPDGTTWAWLAPLAFTLEPGQFLGTTASGKLIFMEYTTRGVSVTERENVDNR